MSRVLCTMPGKFGDLLWALPTCRSLAEWHGDAVDLIVSPAYGAIVPLLLCQPYLDEVLVDVDWQVQDTAPMTPRLPPALAGGFRSGAYDRVYHLGYEGWPSPTLAEDIARRAGMAVDVDRPWISTPGIHMAKQGRRPKVWIGWSEEWFELKVGILLALALRFPTVEFWWLRPAGGRYDEVDKTVDVALHSFGVHGIAATHALGPNVSMITCGWIELALHAQSCDVYLGCLSSAWVLADGLGMDVIAVEPNPLRHQGVFWRQAEKNHLVLGGDGRPTFDARHAGDALATWLELREERPHASVSR